MKTCPHCEGELLRHAKTAYKGSKTIGIRFICRECRKSFTQRFEADTVAGLLFFSTTGRPTLKDWRYV